MANQKVENGKVVSFDSDGLLRKEVYYERFNKIQGTIILVCKPVEN
jgi:hypothetical protein